MAIWTNEKIIELIEHYQKAECIWNLKHPQYKCRNTVQQAWNEISKAIGEDTIEIKRKMKILIGQFYQKYKKYRKMNHSITSSERPSKWFAYNHMLFLQNRKKQHSTDVGNNDDSTESSWSESELEDHNYDIPEQIETPNFEIIDIKNEVSENATINNKDSSNEPITSSTSYHMIHPQRERLQIRQTKFPPMLRKKRIEMMREAYFKDKNKNECDIFGELVACKLKNLKTDSARNTVERLIANILWEASAGKYDDPSTISAISQNESATSTPNDALDGLEYSYRKVTQGQKS